MELEGDVAALRAQLGEQRSEQQDSGRERARALGELSEQNLRLSQQLAQVGDPGSGEVGPANTCIPSGAKCLGWVLKLELAWNFIPCPLPRPLRWNRSFRENWMHFGLSARLKPWLEQT